jgi:hypothetical protein
MKLFDIENWLLAILLVAIVLFAESFAEFTASFLENLQ